MALVVLAGLLLLPSSAVAEGGKSISSAPLVTYGLQQFGNTATGALHEDKGFGCDTWYSFWGLPVTAGDEATVDWESVAPQTEINLMPVGTTDFTFGQTSAVAHQYLADNNKNQLRHRASVSGVMPLVFETCAYEEPGPYAFTATVRHAVFTSLAPRTSMRPTATLTGTAVLADGTPVPDGLAFTLIARWPGRGLAQFNSTSTSGSLSFPVALPPDAVQQSVKFTISRPADASLLATKSSAVKIYVARPAPVHTRRCRRGFVKRKVHGKKKCVRKRRH